MNHEHAESESLREGEREMSCGENRDSYNLSLQLHCAAATRAESVLSVMSWIRWQQRKTRAAVVRVVGAIS